MYVKHCGEVFIYFDAVFDYVYKAFEAGGFLSFDRLDLFFTVFLY